MADNQIEFDVVARLDNIDKQLASIEGKAKKTGKEVADNLGDRVENSIKGSFMRIGVAAAAAGAAILSGLAFKQVIKAASDEQVEINNLNQAMANAGTYSEAASLSFQAFADSIEATTTLTGGAVMEMGALARNFTRSNDEAQKLTKAAIELSAATGMDLNTAVESLGKTLSGTAGRLGQQVPMLQGFTKEQLKAGEALDAVIKRFDGSAASKVNTFSGAFTQLQNTFEKLQTDIGNIIVKSPALVAAFKFISGYINKFAESIKGIGESGADPFGSLLKGAVDVTNFLVGIFGPVLEFTIDLITKTARAIGALAASFVQLVTGEFRAAMNTFKEGVLDELDVESFNFKGTEAAQGFLTGLSTAMASAPPIQTPLSNNKDAQIAAIEETISSVNLFDEVYTALASKVEISSNKITTAFKQVKQAMFQNLVTGVQGAFSSIGSALVKGENVFAAFGKSILGMFGDLALQLGQFYLLLGIGNLWLNPGAAAGQIAAGIGLSILGGALKAIAGSGGGASAPTAAATGGGVGGSGFTSTIGDESTAFQETEQKEPGTQVAVNIHGNVLGDKRTLGREIATALNEAFESDGAIIARGAIA